MQQNRGVGPVANSQRWNLTTAQLPAAERWCTCCERDLTGHAVRMLELDQRNQTYHDFGNVPESQSQGWFPFGLKCAQKKIKEALAGSAQSGGGV